LALTGANTYSGGTTVSTGTLLANNTSGSATGTGALTVNSGATLGGKGIINSTTNTISSGAKVQVGSGGSNTTDVLTMTASSSTTFSGASLTFNLNSANNQSNTLALGATPSVLLSGASLTLNIVGSSIIPNTTAYTLFTSTIGGSSSGFSGSAFGDLTIDGTGKISNVSLNFLNAPTPGYYAASYLQLVNNGPGDGFSIDVEVVPEPGTWALMLGGGGVAGVFPALPPQE